MSERRCVVLVALSWMLMASDLPMSLADEITSQAIAAAIAQSLSYPRSDFHKSLHNLTLAQKRRKALSWDVLLISCV